MLKGKAAVITGSTSGIGLGMARALAAEGCALMLNGLGDGDAIETLRAGLAADHDVEVGYSPADMRRPDEIAGMIADATDRFGRVDILINNAGIQHMAPVEAFPVEAWNEILAVNLSAMFHGIRAVLPQMKARNRGRIVNTASVHGLVASADKSAYVAAKHGVVGLTKTVALETAEYGITCNAICPGSVRTPLVEVQIERYAEQRGLSIEAASRERLRDRLPTMRYIETSEIGALAVFLCSDSAASITGAALPIDGGTTAR